jgi:hypothetical protein
VSRSASSPPFREVEFTAEAVAPELRIQDGDRQAGQTGARLARRLVVQVVGIDDAPLMQPGIEVRFIAETGNGTAVPATTATDAQGLASTEFTLGPVPGTQMVRAVLVAFPSTSGVVFMLSATGFGIRVFAGDEQDGEVGMPLANPLVAELTFNGQPLAEAGHRVRFVVEEGNGALQPIEALTDALGRVQATLRLGSEPGVNRVRADLTDQAGSEPARFTATANRGPPATDLEGFFLGPGTARVNGCNMQSSGNFGPTIAIGPEAGQLTWRSFLDLIGTYQRLLGRFVAQATTMSGPLRITERVDGEFSRNASGRPQFRGDLAFEQENTSTGARCETIYEIAVVKQQ